MGVRGHSLAQERSCFAICKQEADCGGLFIQVHSLEKMRIQNKETEYNLVIKIIISVMNNHHILQDNFCHLVAPSVTSLDVALAMISNPGVDSYTIVEQVMTIRNICGNCDDFQKHL